MKNVGRYILIALLVAAVLFVLWFFKNIVAYILISAILSLIGKPVVDFLDQIHFRNIKLAKGISALITLLLMWFIIITFFRIFIPLIANEANQLSNINVTKVIENLQGPIERLESLINQYSLNKDYVSIEEEVTNYLVSLLNYSLISNLFGSIASVLGNLFIAVFSISFITFFFLKDASLFSNMILLFIPTKYELSVRRALTSVRGLLRRYFLGILLQITGIIILITLGMTIIGVGFKHGLVIGLVVGLMNIIPYLGPVMGGLLGTILGIATHLDMALYNELLPLIGYMILVFIIVQIMDNILFQPLIYSSSVHAHPLEIFLVIMIAGSLAGITGMVLAIPSYTILRVFAREFFNNLKVVKKMTENIS
jgi:predicted PurR-regulated permease PerM